MQFKSRIALFSSSTVLATKIIALTWINVNLLICKLEENYKYEKNTVTKVFDDFFKKLLDMSCFIEVNLHPTSSNFLTPTFVLL